MDNIIKLLGIEDEEIEITKVETIGKQKVITVETKPARHFCPSCGSRMYSRGIKRRKVRHSILQDGYELVINLNQRRWKCTAPDCGYDLAEQFKFVGKYKQTTNATEMLIVDAFRDFSATAAQIGEQFHVSDHHAIDVFERYVHMERLPLTEAISVDEVYLDMDRYCKYVLVIQDFRTGEPIDLVISRRNNITEPYFFKIPREERERVRYLVSDMYNPYIAYVDRYFPNAVPVVDSFHVTQWIIRELDNFLRQLLKTFRQRDMEREIALSEERGRPVTLPVSHEIYLLQHHRWVLLKNQSEINYSMPARKDYHYGFLMDTYKYEELFFEMHPDLQELRSLKEEYICFNSRNAGNPEKAAAELDALIQYYLSCRHEIFIRFANLLQQYRQPIINSFILFEKTGSKGPYNARLSNGPIESLNRKAKDMKRNARGFSNFEHLRNRFLFATRENAAVSFRK